MKKHQYSPALIVTGLILIGAIILSAFLIQLPVVHASGTPIVVTGVQVSLSDRQTAQAKTTPSVGIQVAPDPLHRPTITPKTGLTPNAAPDSVVNTHWINVLIQTLLQIFFTAITR